MAMVYGNGSGRILRILFTKADEGADTSAPFGTASVISFDESVNPQLVFELRTELGRFDTIGGVLRRDGRAVRPNVPAEHHVIG